MKSVVIVAGGSSSRFGANKLKQSVFGKSVLEQSVDAFRNIADEIIVVGDYSIEGVKSVKGGATRFLSVKNGLDAVSDKCDFVAVHDGARPFASPKLVNVLFAQAIKYGSAVPRLPVTDTVWRQDGKTVMQTDRDSLFTVQTPQIFDCAKLKRAFSLAEREYTDESSLYFDIYGDVNFVDGERSNIKITFREDLPEYRVGAGFDVHAFGSGNGVIIGGVTIPFDKKLLGHSDADVLAHAIADAVLSASGNKDIGCRFPDTDPEYKGANSLTLLSQCVDLALQSGFVVVNVSAVVICEEPKMAPYTDEMASKLAEVLKVDKGCVNLSASTTEKLGALGNGDGIAVEAQALLKRVNRL